VILTNPTDKVLQDELPQLVQKEGISSVKLYMTYEPMKLGDADLFNVMMRARGLGITTMVHAENSDMIAAITARLAKAGNTGTFFHSVARPQIAETEATYRAISLAEVTDTPILLVHMSAPGAVRHVADAQSRLLPIHAETCPHYLYLVSDRLRSGPKDVEGSKSICAPPLRHDAGDLEEIWRSVANGTFTTISSDHAPATFDHPNGKKGKAMDTASVDEHGCVHSDFRFVPNGLPGIETRLPLIFNRTFDPTAGYRFHDDKIRISLPRFVQLTSTNPAKLYGLGHRKGSILPGYDADLVIWYPEGSPVEGTEQTDAAQKSFKISNDILHHRIDYTPFEGIQVRNWPRWVFLRGKLVWDRDGKGVIGSKSDGLFLERARSSILTGQMGRLATGMLDGEREYWA
jgi:dihydropyrimidinase